MGEVVRGMAADRVLLWSRLLLAVEGFFFFFLAASGHSWAAERSWGEGGGGGEKKHFSWNSEDPGAGRDGIIIDTVRCRLTLLVGGEPLKTYPVALGKFETPTPLGSYRVVRKAMNWGSGFGSRWLELDVPWGLYGIHGTNKPWSIGSYASHGCIRMHNSDIEELYPLVPLNTRVYIVGNPFTYREPPYRVLRRDFCGSDVQEVQRILKRLGLFAGKVDGTWRWDMEESVYEFRKRCGLPRDNAVDEAVYRFLGLM